MSGIPQNNGIYTEKINIFPNKKDDYKKLEIDSKQEEKQIQPEHKKDLFKSNNEFITTSHHADKGELEVITTSKIESGKFGLMPERIKKNEEKTQEAFHSDEVFETIKKPKKLVLDEIKSGVKSQIPKPPTGNIPILKSEPKPLPTIEEGFNFKAKEMILAKDLPKKFEVIDPEISALLTKHKDIDSQDLKGKILSLNKILLKIKKIEPNVTDKFTLKSLEKTVTYKQRYLRKIVSENEKFNNPKAAIQALANISGLSKGGRALSMDYWLEKVDPLHRSWSREPASRFVDGWKQSGIKSFFTYLETVEYSPDLNSISHVEQFIPEELSKHKLVFSGGMISKDGKPYNTQAEKTAFSDIGSAIFVLGKDNEIYTGSHIVGQKHHSSFFSGDNVLGAGEIKIENNEIKEISDRSGHYKPDKRHMLNVVKALSDKGIDISNTIVKISEKTPDGGIKQINEKTVYLTFNAKQFLDTKSVLLPNDDLNWTGIQSGVLNGQIELLSSKEILTNDKDGEENTLIHLAAESSKNIFKNNKFEKSRTDHDSLLASLIDKFPTDIDTPNKSGDTALNLAVKNGNIEAVKILFSKGSDINIQNKSGDNALSIAIKSNNKEISEFLLEKTDLTKTFPKDNPAHLATFYKNNTLLDEILLKEPSLMNKISGSGFSILDLAIAGKNNEAVMSLVDKKGFDINTVNTEGNTSIHIAVKENNIEAFDFLLSKDPLLPENKKGESPMSLIVKNDNLELFRKILKAKPDLINESKNGLNLLHLACVENSQDIIKEIIDNKRIDIHSKTTNQNEDTIALIAAKNGHKMFLNNLLGTYPNMINDKDSKGNNILHKILSSSTALNNFIKDGGVDNLKPYSALLNIKNLANESPLEIANKDINFFQLKSKFNKWSEEIQN